MPRIPLVTRVLLGLFLVFSLGNAVLGPWLQVTKLIDWLAFRPSDVLDGQLWRLVTYPWFSRPILDSAALGLFLGLFFLYWVSKAMEDMWGTRLYAQRVVILIVVPAVITSLLALLVPAIRGYPFFGTSALIEALIVGFGASMRGARVTMIPIPIALGGDQLIMYGGLFLLVDVLLNGTIFPFVNDIFAFLFALAWFRLGMFRGMPDLRRFWLRLRKKRIERRVASLKARHGLRVVEPDDDEEPRRFLH